jgi:hypothetical protein
MRPLPLSVESTNRRPEGLENHERRISGMNRNRAIALVAFLAAAVLLGGCWGSTKDRTLSLGPAPQPGLVGSAACISCHATTLPTDPSGQPIVSRWQTTTHTTVQGVECEGCHGGGQNHWGVGPIPYPIPGGAQCQACHGKSGFDNTAHANLHLVGGPFGPDKFFFQGNAGTAQATTRLRGTTTDIPEFLPDNVTPVTKGQHVEECSVCHNPNQPFVYDAGRVLGKPDPNNMPNPAPSCAGCHDAHHTQEQTVVPQRAGKTGYPVFRPYTVNASGAQDPAGTPVRGALFQPNGVVTATGAVDPTKLNGKNNELNSEQLCAACHTVGLYKYQGKPTHQFDVYSQWKNSGHGDRTAAAFAEFSANPPAYGFAAVDHQTSYPFDMAIDCTLSGHVADNAHNAGNNNFACFKCHSGIGATAYLASQEKTASAPVLFGDETVTCLTCHSPHSQPAGTESNLRVPRVMSKYSSTQVSFSGNVFFDNTPVPGVAVTGNGTICIFCHQGRESGFTLYKRKNFATGGTGAGSNFFNPHYLGTGAMLWARNGYEFIGAGFDNAYGSVSPHQSANCPTCHMDNPADNNLIGGHTWKPSLASCNAAACHNGAVGNDGAGGPDIDAFRASFDNNNYTGDPGGNTLSIAESIRVLETKLILLLASQATPIYYDDTAYPYFFATQDPAAHGVTDNGFQAWTQPTLKAAFNLSFVIKGLPSAGPGTSTVWLVGGAAPAGAGDVGLPNTSSVLTPNASAAVHNYRYTIQLLQDSYFAVAGSRIPNAVRPSTNRAATIYGANQ